MTIADPLGQHLAAAQLARDTETVRREFPEIFAEPKLTALANLTTQQMLADDLAHGRQRAPLDIYREAARDTLRLTNRTGDGAARGGGDQQELGAKITEDDIERHRRAAIRQIVKERGAQ